MKYFLALFLTLAFPLCAYAQSGEGQAVPADDVISARRLELAQKMHEIWPIRTRIESALDAVADQFPEIDRPKVKATMRKSIQFDQVQEESIKVMANLFTEEELQAMIDFYGSDVGRSISAKTSDYELAMRPIVIKMIDKAMLDLRTGAPQ